jgi:hypothetical protein
MDPDMEVDVEVLDVTDEEARKLLLTIDPLASLAEQQEQFRQRLLGYLHRHFLHPLSLILIPVTCGDDKEQVELLRRFTDEGMAVQGAGRLDLPEHRASPEPLTDWRKAV